MPRVTVQPSGLTIEVGADETVTDAAWRQGYRWPTSCWGRAECAGCTAVLIDGIDHASPIEDDEYEALHQRLPRYLLKPHSRLACRLRISGDIVVEKRGVTPPPAENPSNQRHGAQTKNSPKRKMTRP